MFNKINNNPLISTEQQYRDRINAFTQEKNALKILENLIKQLNAEGQYTYSIEVSSIKTIKEKNEIKDGKTVVVLKRENSVFTETSDETLVFETSPSNGNELAEQILLSLLKKRILESFPNG